MYISHSLLIAVYSYLIVAWQSEAAGKEKGCNGIMGIVVKRETNKTEGVQITELKYVQKERVVSPKRSTPKLVRTLPGRSIQGLFSP